MTENTEINNNFDITLFLEKNINLIVFFLVIIHLSELLIGIIIFNDNFHSYLQGVSALLSGLFSAVAMIVLIKNFSEQKKEFTRLNRDSVKQKSISELSMLGPIYYDIMKDTFNQLHGSEIESDGILSLAFLLEYQKSNDLDRRKFFKEEVIKYRKMRDSDRKNTIEGRNLNSVAVTFFGAYKGFRELYDNAYVMDDDSSHVDSYIGFDATRYGQLGRRLHFYFEPEYFIESFDEDRGAVDQ